MKRLLSVLLVLSFVLLMLGGCGGTAGVSAGENTGQAKDYSGTYQGSAPGYHGDLDVTVTLDKVGKILAVEVAEDHGETENIGTIPIERIPGAIVDGQSLQVDTVTGATITADAILAAVAVALERAGLDPADYNYTPPKAADREDFSLDMSAMPQKAPITDSITITDVKGRQIALDLPISTYAISTMDVIDYLIPLLGEEAFHMLVASGQDGGGGLQTYAKLYTPIIGNYMEHVGQISEHNAPFDLEMILATDPDVLIVNSAMGAHRYALEIEDQLTAAGIPIVLIDVPGKSLATSVQDTVKLLGQIFQKEERAKEIASFIDEQYALVASKKLDQRQDKPTVYYEKSGYSEIFGSTSSSQSGWGTVIALAGGENIADPVLLDSAAGKGGNSTLDPEYVLEANPEFIVLSGSGAGWMDNYPGSTPEVPKFDILNRTGWRELAAVKNGNVYELAHATSRTIFGFHAVLKLASIFYPEDFQGIDVDGIMDEFFDKFMLVDSDVTGWCYQAAGAR
ncbi:MAG: ABC transporter substrate-binding protein [Clostridiales bacterium]